MVFSVLGKLAFWDECKSEKVFTGAPLQCKGFFLLIVLTITNQPGSTPFQDGATFLKSFKTLWEEMKRGCNMKKFETNYKFVESEVHHMGRHRIPLIG